jgi:FkbM family methyltransferase
MATNRGPHKIPLFRRIVLPLLRATARDVSMRNPWIPGARLLLNSYRHKGYWYHRRNRERRTMELFTKLVQPGFQVVEVGAHIGYVTQYLAFLVGQSGSVVAFEPGENNLRYTRWNVSEGLAGVGAGSVRLIEKAVGAETGSGTLYEEDLTGQNNSLVVRFPGYLANSDAAFVPSKVHPRVVPVVSLDVEEKGSIDFIKVDVEGFEHHVLQGARRILETHRPILMVEIQAHADEILHMMQLLGYRGFNDAGDQVSQAVDLHGNIFWIPSCRDDVFRQALRAAS